jgi:acetyl-CoA acetyltransferase
MRSGRRFGQGRRLEEADRLAQWTAPFGLMAPAHSASLWLHRWMHERGHTNRDVAEVSLVQRDYASRNPNAYFYAQPLTIEEHQQGRWIVEPVLRIVDLCLESDGAVALVVTSPDHSGLSRPPVHVRAAARAMGPRSRLQSSYYTDDGASLPDLPRLVQQLWRQSGLNIGDFQVANIYDAFAPQVPMVLESLGVCTPGTAIDFIRSGGTRLDGSFPVNTNGGQIAEAYIHGMNGIAEVVRQVRGTAANQVANVRNALVIASPTMPTSGLVLSSERG